MEILTSPFGSLDLQELAAVSGHHVSFHQGLDGADVPESLVERQQLRREVERGEASAGAAQPALLLTGQGGNGATQQRIGLHGGAEEGVGILKYMK